MHTAKKTTVSDFIGTFGSFGKDKMEIVMGGSGKIYIF